MNFYSVVWNEGRSEWLLRQFKTRRARSDSEGRPVLAAAVPQDLADGLAHHNPRTNSWYGPISTQQAQTILAKSMVLKQRRRIWRTQSS